MQTIRGTSDPRTGSSKPSLGIRIQAVTMQSRPSSAPDKVHTTKKERGEEMAWEEKEQTNCSVTTFLIFLD
jgi:hypothetical protein